MAIETGLLLVYGMALLGFAFRVVAPYAIERWETGAVWEWRYIGAQLAGQVVGLLTLYGTGIDAALAGLQNAGLFGAFAFGYFMTDLGNLGRKLKQAAV